MSGASRDGAEGADAHRPTGERHRGAFSRWAVLVLGASLAGFFFAPRPSLSSASAPDPDAIETSLYLIGDAGVPARGGEPVLAALRLEISRAPEASVVVFLGDNAYPAGLPGPGDPGRAEAERRLDAQSDAVSAPGVRGIFLPGNHDWRNGIAGLIREADHLTQRGGGAVSFLPPGGSPGPTVVDVGHVLRLVILDTDVILREEVERKGGQGTLPDDAFGDSLRAAIISAGERRVVVLGHHPLASGGHHGGSFGWRDHLFPLREIHSSFWIPLPILGSVYPLARKRGISAQDLAHPANRRMVERIEAALRPRRPLIYASGHEHNLQVIRGRAAEYLLVSGAGSYHHTSRASRIPETQFASSDAGFIRVDLMASGRARLVVLAVELPDHVVERFAMWLD